MHQFFMRGKDMCAMGKDAFLARAPPFMGDILWEHLEQLQKGKVIDGLQNKFKSISCSLLLFISFLY